MTAPVHTACIIDDDITFIFVTNHLVESNQLSEEIITYKNGREAIDELKTLQENEERFPEVIFLDINMPVLDGWGFLDEIKTILPQSVRIYLTSSSIDERDLDRSKSYDEVCEYLVKPVDIETLTRIFNEA